MQKFTTDLKDANKCRWHSHPHTEHSTFVSLPYQGSSTLKREQTDRKSQRPEKNSIFQIPQDPTLCMSSHRQLCLPAESPSEEQASQHSSMDGGGAPEPKSLTEELYTVDGFWGQGASFFKDAVPSRWTTLQRMVSHS